MAAMVASCLGRPTAGRHSSMLALLPKGSLGGWGILPQGLAGGVGYGPREGSGDPKWGEAKRGVWWWDWGDWRRGADTMWSRVTGGFQGQVQQLPGEAQGQLRSPHRRV